MAEPSKLNAQRFAQIFLDEYNTANGTHFEWDDIRSYQPKDQPYFDLKFFDGKEELGIQLVLAVADSDREFVRPKRCDKVMHPLENKLKENPKIPSISVYVNFHNPPTTTEEIRQAIYWLEFVITSKAENSLGPAFFSYNATFDGQFIPRISKFVSHLMVSPINDKNGRKYVRVYYGWNKGVPEPWMPDDEKIMKAIEKKERDNKDTVLVVSAGNFPIHDSYITLLQERLISNPIKEIWLVEDFVSPGSRAIRLK